MNEKPHPGNDFPGRWKKDKATLAERAYQEIRHRILHGEIEAGFIGSTRQLARELGIGFGPVRDALRRLESECFVTIAPRRGWILRGRSLRDVLDLFEIRQVLEELVVRRLVGRLTERQIAIAEASIRQHREVLATGQPPSRALVPDFQFHRHLASFQGNRFLEVFVNNLLDQLFPEVYLAHGKAPVRASAAAEEHEALLRALEEGRKTDGIRLIRSHLRRCRKFVLARGRSLP
ncbi:MAG: GntR family transcriptional regulator [Thermoguttaceae bacterium]|nr:GntR family transcriptional regulator [Thermoguttaceae bacterium]MDW8080235.1 GntR family transcriptional regulator [Thermoguttaceae bacterium]